MGKRNVMLLCLSILRANAGEMVYTYEFREKKYEIRGYMTNEAPVKRVIDLLCEEHKKLDRIVMICSRRVLEEKIGDGKELPRDFYTDARYKSARERALKNGKRVVDMTHAEYFEEAVQEYARERDGEAYKTAPIACEAIEISDFADEQKVVKAVAEAAGKVSHDYEGDETDLFIDFNGGPRNVAFLLLEAANLLKQRQVRTRDITSMDYDNKKEGKIPICSMTAVFESMDLVSGIHEYVQYGRIRLLKKYFQGCSNQTILGILDQLESFANSLQLCLTDYVMNSREKVRSELEQYRKQEECRQQREGSEQEAYRQQKADPEREAYRQQKADPEREECRQQKGDPEQEKYPEQGEREDPADAYEIMFSFVAEDILNGCRKLLEGELPEMIQWCVEKEFIQQALTLYLERTPGFLWEKGIFRPTRQEQADYQGWQLDCELGENDSRIIEIYNRRYRTGDAKYCWMVHYLPENSAALQKNSPDRTESPEKRTAPKITETATCASEYDQQEADTDILAGKKAADLIHCLHTGRAESILEEEQLCVLLTEYFAVWNQCMGAGKGIAEQSDRGELWEYEEMCRTLQKAAGELRKALDDLPDA